MKNETFKVTCIVPPFRTSFRRYSIFDRFGYNFRVISDFDAGFGLFTTKDFYHHFSDLNYQRKIKLEKLKRND